MGAAKALAAADALEACRSESRRAAAAREAAFRAAMDRKDAEVANVAAESLRQELHDAAAAAAVVAAVVPVRRRHLQKEMFRLDCDLQVIWRQNIELD